MKEHPILFSSEMVQAILAGRKTQTRRPMKGDSPEAKCPWKPGDRLWVRETWGVGCRPHPLFGCVDGIEYKADALDGDELPLHVVDPPVGIDLEDFLSNGWRPSIHMPRWACRLFLEVDDVEIHRLQDISEDEAKAEGLESISAFHFTWNSLYSALQYRWESNPWVYCTKFHITELL